MADSEAASVEEAFSAATRSRDYAAAAHLGLNLIRSTNLPLQKVWQVVRAAGFDGNLPVFSEASAAACRLANQIRGDERSFGKNWKQVLKFDLESADVEAALSVIARALDGYSTDKMTLKPVIRFLTDNRDLLKSTHDLVREARAGNVPQASADLCIGAWFRLLTPAKETFNARHIWLTVTEEAAGLANSRGQRVLLIPDYLAPIVEVASTAFLSFHTEGRRRVLAHFKPADLPGYAVIDPEGYSGWSSLAKKEFASLDLPSPAEAEEFFTRHRQEVVDQNISKYSQPDPGNEGPLPDQFVFVPLQVATDRTQSLARISMLEMLGLVVARFRDSPIKVVVKRHPKCRSDEVASLLNRLEQEGSIVLRKDSIHSLVSNSLAVFTVNSGVGSEAMIHLKPIYLFGEADYNCAAHRIGCSDDFWRLTSTISPALSEKEMKQFLCYYRTNYLVWVDDQPRLETMLNQTLFN